MTCYNSSLWNNFIPCATRTITPSATCENLRNYNDIVIDLPIYQQAARMFVHGIFDKRYYTTTSFKSSSTKPSTPKTKRKRKFIPPKAIVNLTPKSRNLFKTLLSIAIQNSEGKNNNDGNKIIGILLKYQQSSSGEPRMVFQFDFLRQVELENSEHEGVSLEVKEDGKTPKNHRDSIDDGLLKLYIHSDAVMKVLGCTIDIDDKDGFTPLVYDRDGVLVDPNY